MRRYVSIALLAATALMLVIYLSPDPAPFSIYNPGPQGASKVAQICHITSLEDASVVIVAPGAVPPAPRPGQLIIVTGPTNETLKALGVDAYVEGGAITDAAFNALNPNYPLAAAGNYTIALYRPPPLAPGPAAAPLAQTSEYSTWRGAQGSYVVAIYQRVGGAEVVAVSSPYVFTNALLAMAQNAQWLKSLCGDKPTAYLGGVVDARAALWRAVRTAPQTIVLIPLVALLVSIWPKKT
ncbi:MAG: hypothetical protein QXP98_04050 [Thermoproteus sp.]